MTDTSNHAPHFILGTAGHIDHGKTTLIKALTGIDTDWLPEEKARGMTIDIGIADITLGGSTVGVVDVPGHERFVRTMVAGASGIDLALLVVAADDGVMPQTEEHLEILNLLGVDVAVVALNKVDLVSPERVEEVKEEIELLLLDTPLEQAPVVEVSGVTGQGLPELKAALEGAVPETPHRRRSSFLRVPVDRIFSIPGRGTVITGSMLGGEIHVGDSVELLPGGRRLRVRGLQTHNRTAEDLVAGQRTAVNLAGLKKEEVHRGMEVAEAGYLTPSTYLDVRVRCLPGRPKGIPTFVRVRLALGTSDVLGRLVLLEGKHLKAGDSALCQLRLHDPVVAEYGQRFILRDETAVRTLGGGTVLRPVARRIVVSRAHRECTALSRLETGDDRTRVDQVLADAGIEKVADTRIAACAGVAVEAVRESLKILEETGDLMRIQGIDDPVHKSALETLGDRICRFLKRFHDQNPFLVGLGRNVLHRTFLRTTPESVLQAAVGDLEARGTVVVKLDKIALATFKVQRSEGRVRLWERILRELLDGGFTPPSEAKLVEIIGSRPTAINEILQQAEANGEVVQVTQGIFFPVETVEALKEKMREVHSRSGPFSLAAIREYVGSTRRYMVPLCEYLDAVGFTRREGDLRRPVEE